MSLQAFQTEIGTTPDGVFGPATMKAAMARYGWTGAQAAHFFGNTAHETGDYHVFSENLNYDAIGLLRNWPSHFTAAEAAAYAHKPVAIANRAYANRMGNGDEASGDGWAFRGRGAIQTTGRNNYLDVSRGLNRPDIMTNPDLLANDLAMDSAIFFFTRNHIWPMCSDVSDATIAHVRHVLNGGSIGLPDVTVRVKKYAQWGQP